MNETLKKLEATIMALDMVTTKGQDNLLALGAAIQFLKEIYMEMSNVDSQNSKNKIDMKNK